MTESFQLQAVWVPSASKDKVKYLGIPDKCQDMSLAEHFYLLSMLR